MQPNGLPVGLIGVVHLPAMPGDPGFAGGGVAAVEESALRDAETLVNGGVDGLIVENYGSTPFRKGTAGERLDPHQVAILAHVTRDLRRRFEVPVGVNCLRNDAISALGIAATSELEFVRVNVHTGAYVTDQGLIEGEAHESLRYRERLGVSDRVAILADVLVKHAAPLAPLDPGVAASDCLERGHADGVIVTGDRTGGPVDEAMLESVRDSVGDAPVFLGSGLVPDDVDRLVPFVDGAIVGTWFKLDGEVAAPVVPGRVRQLVDRVAGKFRRG